MAGRSDSPITPVFRGVSFAVAVLLAACSSAAPADSGRDIGPSVPAIGSTPDESDALPVDEVEYRGGVVRLSEVMYHAPLEDAAAEFIELVNVGDQAVNLQEWCITGTGHCFTEVVQLEPGGYHVVFQSEIAGNLSNGGERLELVDSLGQVVDAVDYDDSDPWPSTADGGGESLHRIDVAEFGPAAWAAAAPTPGGPYPGGSDVAVGDVVITEVHYHPVDDDPARTFVEVMNRSAAPVDLEGWCLRGTSFCWGTSATLAPGTTTVAVPAAGELSRAGERLRVVDPTGVVHDTIVYVDHGDWPAVADGYGPSLHRRDTDLPGDLPGNWDAAAPSPGSLEPTPPGGLLPVFADVAFTVLPGSSDPIEVSARVVDATAVSLGYVVDFGDEVVIDAAVDGGRVSASIPSQPPGSLVRFRLIGETIDGAVGSWPREGDGMRYAGTVVAEPDADTTPLPRLQWFMPDAVWEAASADRFASGDDGYPVVLALDGVVFDNATVRIKGNQARFNKKKKWKIRLPAGHHWDAGGLFRQPVDQFDLLPAATDKSFSREALVADLQELSGGLSQQVFPIRVERNGEFLGLYLYGESPDGGWRDLMGFSDDVYVWKAELISKLRTADLALSDDEFGRHYERVTMGWLDDGDVLLRDLIATLGSMSGDDAVAWAFGHVDVPQVVEALATMRIVQHSEWQHKNYFVMFDPADDLWRLVPIDFDMTFGRWYHAPCNALCDEILAQPYLEYPGENRLAAVFLDNEPLRSMVDRRTRELAEVYLAEGYLEGRMADLLTVMAGDAELDRRRWGAYGEWQTMEMAQNAIVRSYLTNKRRLYLGPGSVLPEPQPGSPSLSIVDVATDAEGQVISARIVNREEMAIDVSNRALDEIGAVLPAGLVLPPGGSVVVVFEAAPFDGPAMFRVVADRID
jgi:hypothetical protein